MCRLSIDACFVKGQPSVPAEPPFRTLLVKKQEPQAEAVLCCRTRRYLYGLDDDAIDKPLSPVNRLYGHVRVLDEGAVDKPTSQHNRSFDGQCRLISFRMSSDPISDR
ncbi:hypothetical protein KEM48_013608 [Puccinia striiformis f. sp. tritici PST-130]|nr:hypothetical protein KEM48_013608 [Puccinia striiformis f. sp. tritici PST-130]